MLLTEPTVEPVTLAETKKFVDISHDDDDLLIERLITASRKHIEMFTSSSLVRQEHRLYLDSFQEACLPLGPVQEISQVQYIDIDGVTQTVATSVYELSSDEDKIMLSYGQTWPSARYQENAVWVDYYTGYFNAAESPIDLTETVPSDIKVALMMMVHDLYDNPSSQQNVQSYKNPAFDALIGLYRKWV